jgi:RES domain
MTGMPGEHPLPHPGLNAQKPLIFTLRPGDVLYRHHQSILDPIFFGMSGDYRFDDPDCPTSAAFGVLYAGEDPHCCFIESCGLTTGVPAVSGAYLDAREIARLELTEELRFVDLASSGGLTHVGADARLVTGSYKVAQRWSAALRLHPSKPDGIRYLARHDPTRVAYAIFTRPRSTFNVTSLSSLTAPSNRALLNQLLTDYNVDLI